MVLQTVFRQYYIGCAKGVGLDNVRPGGQIGPVDVFDHIGAGYDQILVAPLVFRSSKVTVAKLPLVKLIVISPATL